MNNARHEGNGVNKLIREISAVGYNKDIEIELATVTAPPPAIKIRIDGMTLELDADDLIIAESLTKHTRQVKIDGVASTLAFDDELKKGDRVTVASINEGQLFVVLDRAVSY